MKFSVGDLKIRVDDDVNRIPSIITDQIIEYFMSCIFSIIYIIIIFILSWKMALISILLVPMTLIIGQYVGKGQKLINEKLWNNQSCYNSWILDTINNWKEVKALGIERNQVNKFKNFVDEECKYNVRWMLYFTLNVVFRRFKNNFIMNIFLYFIGGILIIQGEQTIGKVLMFMTYYNYLFTNVDKINDYNISLRAMRPSLDRVFSLISSNTNSENKALKDYSLNGNISFEGIIFSYDSENGSILDNFNLSIRAGEKVALVGNSGIGKTTIIKMLLGLCKPQSGKITIDGYNIEEINPSSLHKNIGVVMQDGILFNLSIKENLLLANPKATDDEIVDACKKAAIYDFIENLPEKYETIIGERGVKLSGGQKQRIAIARVFLSMPNIIVFDEATSSLDKDTENIIYESINLLPKDRTILIITHNISTLRYADRVIEIKGKLQIK